MAKNYDLRMEFPYKSRDLRGFIFDKGIGKSLSFSGVVHLSSVLDSVDSHILLGPVVEGGKIKIEHSSTGEILLPVGSYLRNNELSDPSRINLGSALDLLHNTLNENEEAKRDKSTSFYSLFSNSLNGIFGQKREAR